MILGGLVEAFLGVNAEGKSLEDVASPLSAVRKVGAAISDAARSSGRGPLPQGPGS